MDKDVIHIYNVMLLSHKKEWTNAICRNMDEPRGYHTKWSQTKKIIWYHLYKESNKKDKNEVIYKTEIDSDILKSNLLLSKGNVGGKW